MTLVRCLALVLAVGCVNVAWAQRDDAQGERLSRAELRSEFERRYDAWQRCLQEMPTDALLLHGDPLLSEECASAYGYMMDLGLRALPYIMQKIEAGDWWLARGVYRMTKRRFHRSEYAEPSDYGDAHTKAEMLVAWWHSGEKGTRRRFEELYARWGKLKSPERTLLWTAPTYLYDERGTLTSTRAETQFTEAGEVYDAVQCLGIPVLPQIVDTLRQGQADFLPIALELTEGAGGLGEPTTPPEPAAFVDWWEANKQDWLIPWPEEEAEE